MQTQLFTQNFKIIPAGNVQSGTATYSFDPATGKITYNVATTYKIFGIYPKDINEDGWTFVDPKKMLSATVKPGAVLDFGAFKVTVEKVTGATAVCAVETTGNISAQGTAQISIGGQYVKIHSLSAKGSDLGMAIDLEMVEV